MKTEQEIKKILESEEVHLKSLLSSFDRNEYRETYDSNLAYIEGWIEALKWVLEGGTIDASKEESEVSPF